MANQLMEKNYQGLAASQLILSKQLHDFGNHLKTLEALTAESPKAQQYISQLLSATYKNMPRCRSGNDIIDAIVNCKARFEADVEFSEGTRSFGLRFYENEETSQSYQYLFNIEENRYRFEKSPNMPWPANQNIGLERPIRLEAGKKYHIQMILDDTIATIYVDGVALNTRFYQKFGQSLSLFVTDGTLTVTNAGLSKTIK